MLLLSSYKKIRKNVKQYVGLSHLKADIRQEEYSIDFQWVV